MSETIGQTETELDTAVGIAPTHRTTGPRIRSRSGIGGVVIALAGVGLLPHVVEGLTLRLVTLSVIWYLAVLGLQVLMGQTGLINIGQAGFVGVGAYTSALLAVNVGLSFWVTLPLAALASAVLAVFVGIPTLKLRSHYLAIATVGVGEIVFLLLLNLKNITNGADGVVGIPKPVTGNTRYFYLAVGFAALMTLGVHLIRRSPIGLAFNAVKTDEFAAASMGVSVGFHTMFAFIVSAVCAGVAGALFAHFEGFISPSAFALQQSILLLTMIVIGGTQHISGALIGAVLITFLPEQLRDVMGQSYLLMYGVVVLLMVLFAPLGIAGLVGSLKDWAMRKARGRSDGGSAGAEANHA